MVLSQDKEKIKREEQRTIGAAKSIFDMLGIEQRNDYRIEAFDISNTSGLQSVGSMIVYENGKPKRNDFRKFKIKTVVGPDDYASMKEVLTRRFTHNSGVDEQFDSFNRWPDLIMMDGGRGQVNIALEVLDELKISIPVCGMVKDDHHNTRGLYYNNIELPIDTHSESFHLITRIQDEAHRFAIEFHRSLRAKGQVRSILDDIEGIGPVRRKALMKHFKSIEDIKNATLEELMAVEGMNLSSAQSVVTFFSKKSDKKD
jgi:excinuclease ABC subunit C